MASTYAELTTESCAEYVDSHPATMDLVGPASNITVTEVTDGNLNRVFIAKGSAGSVCIKQSLPYVRVVPTWPLFRERLQFEHAAMQEQAKHAPGLVPRVYVYDPEQFVIAMQVLKPHVVLRGALLEGKCFPKLASGLATFLANTLFGTSDLAVTPSEKRKMLGVFCGNHPMHQLTEEGECDVGRKWHARTVLATV